MTKSLSLNIGGNGMKLSKKQMECMDKINSEWLSVWDVKPTIHMNTVYALFKKGLINIKWEGEVPNRKPYIRKIG